MDIKLPSLIICVRIFSDYVYIREYSIWEAAKYVDTILAGKK